MSKIYFLILTILLTNLYTQVIAKTISIDLEIETERGITTFEIHGDKKDSKYMTRVETILKDHAKEILDYFKYRPTTNIHIIFNKEPKMANGSAAVFPRNIINLFTFPPNGNGHLITGEDWIKGLLLHELVHIVHLDQTRGFTQVIRNIFGSFGKLGGIVPRWFAEGIAVWAETHFTKGGRLKQRQLQYEFETLFLDEKFCSSLDCLDDPGSFPHRQYPYWIGGSFLNWVENQKSGTISCLVWANSGKFPFFLNSSFKYCTGKSIYNQFKNYRSFMVENIKSKLNNTTPWVQDQKVIDFYKDSSPNLQKNWIVSGDQLVYSSYRDRIESLTTHNLTNQEQQYERLPFHIENFNKTQNSSEIIISGSKYDRLNQERYTYLYDLNQSKLNQTSTRGDYPNIVNNEALYLKFNNFTWNIYRDKEKIYTFPFLTQVNFAKFYTMEKRQFLMAQIVDSTHEKPYQVWAIQLEGNDKPSTSHLLLADKEPLNTIGMCKNKILLNKNKKLYLVENTSLDQSNVKSVNFELASDIAQMRWSNQYTVTLLSSKPGLAFVKENGCQETIDEFFAESSNKTSQTEIIPSVNEEKDEEKKKIEIEKVLANSTTSSYPKASHFIPHWWMFSYYAGTQIANWQVSTSINDPKSIHNLSLTLKYFPDISEASPTGRYTYNIAKFKIGAGYDRNFYNSSLKIKPDQTESQYLFVSRSFKKWGWYFIPQASYNIQNTEDIFGKKEVRRSGLQTVFFKERLFDDSFVQSIALFANGRYEQIENGNDFIGEEFKLMNTLQPFRSFNVHLLGSYAKLFNDNFLEGVIYAGGQNDYESASFHPFYGIASNDAYGREVITYRAQGDLRLFKTYRGFKMSPFYLKTISAIAGVDYLKTDRIYVSESKRYAFDTDISGTHLGVRGKMTLFYFVPVDIDLILNKTNNPVGSDYISSLFLVKASLFL